MDEHRLEKATNILHDALCEQTIDINGRPYGIGGLINWSLLEKSVELIVSPYEAVIDCLATEVHEWELGDDGMATPKELIIDQAWKEVRK